MNNFFCAHNAPKAMRLFMMIVLVVWGIGQSTAKAQLYHPDFQDSLLAIYDQLDELEKAKLLYDIGGTYVYGQTGKPDSVYTLLRTLAESGDRPESQWLADDLKGFMLCAELKYAEALTYVFPYQSQLEDENIDAWVRMTMANDIGNMYSSTEYFEQSKAYYEQAIKISREIGFVNQEINTTFNLGLQEYYRKDYNSALDYFMETGRLAVRHNRDIIYYESIGIIIMISLGDLNTDPPIPIDSLLAVTKAAIAFNKETNTLSSEGSSYTELGLVLQRMGDIAGAKVNFLKAVDLFKAPGSTLGPLSETLNYLKEIAVHEGDYEKALYYTDLNKAHIDSLEEWRGIQELASTKSDYEKSIIEALLVKEQEKSKYQRLVGWGLGIIILLLLALVVSFYRNQRQKSKQVANLESKNAEIREMANTVNTQYEELKSQAEVLNAQNETIKGQKQELETISDTKTKIISIISHDFRSPLSSLKGAMLLLQDNTLSIEDISGIVDSINNRLDHNLDLIENLLAWTQSQLGGLKADIQPTPVSTVAQKIIDSMYGLAVDKKVSVTHEVEEGTQVFADEKMLTFVLRNLVSNGLKFTPHGGSVVIRSQTSAGRTAISVEDTGIGIPQDRLDKLFTWSSDRSTRGTGHEKGTGIGLLISKEFLEEHDTLLEVSSTIGEGSTFTFTLDTASNEVVMEQ